MEEPVKLLLMIVSWKGHEHLWNEIINRGYDDLVILCGGNEETHLENKILHLKCNDSYEGLPEKIICGIDFLLNDSRFNSYTHILKIDDHDCIFTRDVINNLIIKHSNILNSQNYIGQYIAYYAMRNYHFNRMDSQSYWYNRPYVGHCEPFIPGWATYILSKHAMTCINNTFNSKSINFVRRNFILEDVMIGLILSAYNILPYDLKYGIKSQ